jgi:hypothetical protein
LGGQPFLAYEFLPGSVPGTLLGVIDDDIPELRGKCSDEQELAA